MQERFKPVLESNAEMANEITQDLVPIREELETLNKLILDRNRLNRIQMGSPRRLPIPYHETPPRPEHYGSIAAKYLRNALNDGNDVNDTTGIQHEAHNMIGDKKWSYNS